MFMQMFGQMFGVFGGIDEEDMEEFMMGGMPFPGMMGGMGGMMFDPGDINSDDEEEIMESFMLEHFEEVCAPGPISARSNHQKRRFVAASSLMSDV